MKKKKLSAAVLFFNIIISGQVGVNTTAPSSTLDIVAKNGTGASTLVDGLLIPRVDRQRALSMVSVKPSTLIYVNDISTGTATGQASNINTIGFYYFEGNGNKWSKINVSPDIFVNDPANATIKAEKTSTGLARGAGTEFMVKDNGNVGIGTITPTQKLDINGNVRVRQIPDLQKDASFYKLGVNDAGELAKETSISSFSTYLGFSPMASTHVSILPITLESGYLTRITGTSIGACNGVMVDFTIYFIGTTYLGASLQGRSTTSTTAYTPIILASNKSIFGTPIEKLANAASSCSSNTGHTLSYSNGQITDTFNDLPAYYANAGLFIIYSIDKIKQTN